MIDAHVHIERGPYTTEWVDEFIGFAQARGITELYILEHSHRFREFDNLYWEFRRYGDYQKNWLQGSMTLSLSEYQELVSKCRMKTYPIKVRFGLEVCYAEAFESETKALTHTFDWDFLTGSVHWVDGFGFDHKKEFWQGKDVDRVYVKYYEKMIHLAESRLFHHLAHPDSIKCFNHLPEIDLEPYYVRLANSLTKNGMKAEFSGGLFNNYGHTEIGMNAKMLKVFKEHQVQLITASDAHRPQDVGKSVEAGLKIIQSSEIETAGHS